MVGGGPAGLSAALVLGRARRRVAVIDAGAPRNRWSRALHGYLSRDGTPPADFLKSARAELAQYTDVRCIAGTATDAVRIDGGFRVTLHDGVTMEGRTLLMATGVVDDIPDIDGLQPLYGVSVHHCPYCDGWEHRDAPIAVLGCGEAALKYVLAMTRWSRDLAWCTDGVAISPHERRRLTRLRITVREERIRRLDGRNGQLERIVFQEGSSLPREALFFCTGQRQHSDLAERLGCRFNSKGTVETRNAEASGVPGVWVAGDASKDAQLVIVAAAEGAEAAVAINVELTRQDLHKEETGANPKVYHRAQQLD